MNGTAQHLCTDSPSSADASQIKHWGVDALSAGAGSGGKNVLNFPLTDYLGELDGISEISTEELVTQLRRKSCGTWHPSQSFVPPPDSQECFPFGSADASPLLPPLLLAQASLAASPSSAA